MKAKMTKWERNLLEMIQKELEAVGHEGPERKMSESLIPYQINARGKADCPGRVEICAREIYGIIRAAHMLGVINEHEKMKFQYSIQGAISWEHEKIKELEANK